MFGEVLRQAGALAAAGTLLGTAASFALTPAVVEYVNADLGITAARPEPVILAGSLLLLAAAALTASWRPARRATRIDPMAVLRHD